MLFRSRGTDGVAARIGPGSEPQVAENQPLVAAAAPGGLAAAAPGGQWEFCTDQGAWQAYEPAASLTIEAAFRSPQTPGRHRTVLIRSGADSVDLNANQETNIQSQRKREVRRRETGAQPPPLQVGSRHAQQEMANDLKRKLSEKKATLRMMRDELQMTEEDLRPLQQEVAQMQAQLSRLESPPARSPVRAISTADLGGGVPMRRSFRASGAV